MLFTSVAGALTWYLTRLIRDGVVWNWEEPPHLLKCVGAVAVSPSNVEPISIPVRNGSRLSQKESTFFSEVEFFAPVDSSLTSSLADYMTCRDSMYHMCASGLNPMADYQLSSNSTYKSNRKCASALSDDLYFMHSVVLSSLRAQGGPFIRLEKNLSHVYSLSYCDLGKSSLMILLLMVLSSTNYLSV